MVDNDTRPYQEGDIIRTKGSPNVRKVLSTTFQNGGCATHPNGCVSTRGMRRDREFGPFMHNALDRITLVTPVST